MAQSNSVRWLSSGGVLKRQNADADCQNLEKRFLWKVFRKRFLSNVALFPLRMHKGKMALHVFLWD